LKRPDRILSNDRGVALLITLAIVTILIAVGIEINRKVRNYVTATYTNRNHLALTHLSLSGTNAAMAMLVKDRQESDTDSLLDDWADPEKIETVLADLPFENGRVSIKISDVLSRIQVNALVQYPERRNFNARQRIIWDQLLRSFISLNEEFEEIDPNTIINSAKDWLDSGDDDAITGLTGAESDYYQGLDRPYESRNGPFLHIAELALVRGFSKDLLYGTDSAPGILDHVTVFGVTSENTGKAVYKGSINLNTADPEVIAAVLPMEHIDLAISIDDYRQLLIEAKNIDAFKNAQWYKEAPGCSDIEIDSGLLTVSSDLFRIEATATLQAATLITETIVQREKQKKTGKWRCKVLRWEAK
jgi:general secretion pathway protein K